MFKYLLKPMLMVALLLGCRAARADEAKSAGKSGATVTSPSYIIQPNDTLEIFVWKEPDLTRKVLVRPDGQISLPLIKELRAAGTTTSELTERIEARLKEFVVSPNVTVMVDTNQSYKIFVTGRVQRPGTFTPDKAVSVLQALTLAGGFQDFAKKSEVSVIRGEGDEQVIFRFNYQDVVKGKNQKQNIILKPGDVVVVP